MNECVKGMDGYIYSLKGGAQKDRESRVVAHKTKEGCVRGLRGLI